MATCIHATWLLFWTIHKFQRFGDFTMKRWNFFFTKEQRTARNSFGETWLCCASSWLTRGYKDVAPSCFLQCTCNTTGKICFSGPCETEPSKYKISSNMRCCPGERFVRREAGWERRPRGRTRDGRKARWRGKGGRGNQAIWNPGTRGHPFVHLPHPNRWDVFITETYCFRLIIKRKIWHKERWSAHELILIKMTEQRRSYWLLLYQIVKE